MEDEIVKINLGEKTIALRSEDWNSEVLDIDEISKIDYSNLFGEIITASALLNKIGRIKADAEYMLNDFKLQLQITESQKRKDIVKEFLNSGMKKPSEASLDDDINTDAKIIAMRKRLSEIRRDCDYIDALYWAIQSKDKKLSILLKGVTPEEFENGIIESKVNTYVIKKFNSTL